MFRVFSLGNYFVLEPISQTANESEIEVGDKKIKPQRITGKHLNQGTPIAFLIIFWGYLIMKILGFIP